MKQYFMYFLTKWTNEVLYTGVNDNLERRTFEHKHKLAEGFSKKYELVKVVYFEVFDDPRSAIAREKQIKNWSRKKKDILVMKINPEWRDLSQDWYDADPSTSPGMTLRESCS
ncbi:MAG: GIY-YIG nuclease family protein [Alphaproteobacteria bacterium]